MIIPDALWLAVKDGDERAAAIFRRHYSYHQYRDGRRRHGYRNRFLMLGPGEKMVLLSPNCDALFCWRKFIDRGGQSGVNCAIFRNESPVLSSTLILAAEQLAWVRWPGQRLYTYVNAGAIASSNPGYCYQMAGWHKCGTTAAKQLIILEKYPTMAGTP